MTLPQKLSDAPRAGISQACWDGALKSHRRIANELRQLGEDLAYEKWDHGYTQRAVERLRKESATAHELLSLLTRTLWEESPHNGCAGDNPGTCPACLAIDKFEKWTESDEGGAA